MASKLILRPNGKILLSTPGYHAAPYDKPLIGTPTQNCCCDASCGCCSATMVPPIPNLWLNFEGPCAALNNLALLELVYDNPLVAPSGDVCWRATLNDINPPGECFGATYTLCCCSLPTRFCLTIDATIAAGCILIQSSVVLAECACTPFELVFTAPIGEVIPGNCTCCTVDDVVTMRITL